MIHLSIGVLLDHLKINEIIKFPGKWMMLESNLSGSGNPDPKRQIYYVFTYIRMSAVKYFIKVYSILARK